MDTIEAKPFKDESMVIPITARGLVDQIFGELAARTIQSSRLFGKSTMFKIEMSFGEWNQMHRRYQELVKKAKP